MDVMTNYIGQEVCGTLTIKGEDGKLHPMHIGSDQVVVGYESEPLTSVLDDLYEKVENASPGTIDLDVNTDNTEPKKAQYTNAYGHLSSLAVDARVREGSSGSYDQYISGGPYQELAVTSLDIELGQVTDETQIYLRVLITPVIDGVGQDYALDCSITDYNLSDLLAAGETGVKMTIDENPDVPGSIKPITSDLYVSLTDLGEGVYRVSPFLLEEEPVLTADLIVGETRVDFTPLLEQIGGKIVAPEPITDINTGEFGGDIEIGELQGSYTQWITPQSSTKTSDAVTIVTSTWPDVFSVNWLQTSNFTITNYVFDWDNEQEVYAHNSIEELLAAGETGVPAVVYRDGGDAEPTTDYDVYIIGSMTEDNGLYTFTFKFRLGDKTKLLLGPSVDSGIDLSPIEDIIDDKIKDTSLNATVSCDIESVAQSFEVGINVFDGDGSTLSSPVKLTFLLATPESVQEKTFDIRFGADGKGGVSVCYPYNVFVPTSMEERTFDYFRDTEIWKTGSNAHYAVPLSNGCIVDTWVTDDHAEYPNNYAYGKVHAKLYGPKAESPRMIALDNDEVHWFTVTIAQGETATESYYSGSSIYPYPTHTTRIYRGETYPEITRLSSTPYVSPYLGAAISESGNAIIFEAPVNTAAWWPDELSGASIRTALPDGTEATTDLACLAGYISTALAREDDRIEQINDTLAEIKDYTGATDSAYGVHGLVPAATSAEKDNFLKGDGTWGSPASVALAEDVSIAPTFFPSRSMLLNNNFNLFTSSNSTAASYDDLTQDTSFKNMGNMSNVTSDFTDAAKEFVVETDTSLSGKYLYCKVRVGTWEDYIVYRAAQNTNDAFIGTSISHNGTPVTMHLTTIDSTYSSGDFPPFSEIEITMQFLESGQYYGPIIGTRYRYKVIVNAVASTGNVRVNLNSFKVDTVSEVLNRYHPYLRFSKAWESQLGEDRTVTGDGSNYWTQVSSTAFDAPSVFIKTPAGTPCSGNVIAKFADNSELTITVDNLVSSDIRYTWVFFHRIGTLLVPLVASGTTTASLLVPFENITNYPVLTSSKITAIKVAPLTGETTTLPAGTQLTIYSGNNYGVF